MRLQKVYTSGRLSFLSSNLSFITVLKGETSNYLATIDASQNSTEIICRYRWWTSFSDSPNVTTQVSVSDETSNILNDALSRIATNSVRAHIALATFTSVDSYTIKLEGTAELGTKYKKWMATGGGFSAGVEFTIKTTDGLINETKRQNQTIQFEVYNKLREKNETTAWSPGKEVSLGEKMPGKNIVLAAQFGHDVRRIGNEIAKDHYNKSYEIERLRAWRDF